MKFLNTTLTRRGAFDPLGDTNALRRFDNVAGIGAAGSPTGAYVFELPIGFNNHMQVHEFVGYYYGGGKGGYRFRVSFYSYNVGPQVVNPTVAYDTGIVNDAFVRPLVRIGRRISSGNPVIIVGDIAVVWSYSRLHLKSSWLSAGASTETSLDTTPAPVLVTDLSPYDLITAPVNTSVALDAANTFTLGTLPIARGGTAGTAAPTAGGSAYGTGAAYAFTAAGTAGQVLASTGATAPAWATLDLTYQPTAWVKQDARVATTANITLSGPQTIDGIAVVAGDRVLVKDQTLPAQNGIYLAAAGAWTRTTDADSTGEIAGAMLSIDYGTLNGGTTWTTTFKASDTIGTTAMTWGPVGAPPGGTTGYLLASGGTGQATWARNDLTALPGSWPKESCRVATTAQTTLSAPQTIDGVAVIAGDRVLVKNQTLPQENGIYVVAAGAWTRAPDANTSGNIAGGVVALDAGAVGGGQTWITNFKPGDTLGTTAMNWYLMLDTGSGVTLATPQTITGAKTFQAATAATTPVVVKAAASPTADLQQWVASDGTTMMLRLDAQGRLFSTAPTGFTDTGSNLYMKATGAQLGRSFFRAETNAGVEVSTLSLGIQSWFDTNATSEPAFSVSWDFWTKAGANPAAPNVVARAGVDAASAFRATRDTAAAAGSRVAEFGVRDYGTHLDTVNAYVTKEGTLAGSDLQAAGLSVGRGAQSGAAGYAQITATTTVNATTPAGTDVPGLQVSVTVPAGRRLKITCTAQVMTSAATATDLAQIRLLEGAALISVFNSPSLPPSGVTVSLGGIAVITPTAGTHVYNIKLARVSGSGNINMYGASSVPDSILVEDIGPA